MFTYPIDADGHFSIDRINFRIDLRPGNQRTPSDEHAFTIVKSKTFLDIYAELSQRIRPKSILELGIFQGGGYMLLDKLFRPQRMSAVDISPAPIAPLMDYIARTPGRSAHFKTSQDNEEALLRIINHDLDGRIDMIVDDASHLYEFTKRSFEILFPLLPVGGIYVIEDWAWSHQLPYQGANATWHDQIAMSTLIMELVALLGSHGTVQKIEVHRPFTVITRGPGDASDVFAKMLTRDKAFPRL